MQIRLAVRSDYDQLLDLLRQLNPTDPEASEIELKVFEEIIESKHFDLVVAYDEDIILGTCYINIIPNITRGGRPYAVIENVVTDSAHRRYGIGRALVNKAVEIAWEQNCYKVMLLSGRGVEAVRAFYKKCGFDENEKQAYVKRAP
jgi:GNAT superfamily N-acetyltransferase